MEDVNCLMILRVSTEPQASWAQGPIMLTPITPSSSLTIGQSGNCARSDHKPCDLLPLIWLLKMLSWNPCGIWGFCEGRGMSHPISLPGLTLVQAHELPPNSQTKKILNIGSLWGSSPLLPPTLPLLLPSLRCPVFLRFPLGAIPTHMDSAHVQFYTLAQQDVANVHLQKAQCSSLEA